MGIVIHKTNNLQIRVRSEDGCLSRTVHTVLNHKRYPETVVGPLEEIACANETGEINTEGGVRSVGGQEK